MTTSAPFFSLVVPTFNRSAILPFAIRSVLGQTFGDLELVVCDNFSEDGTREVVSQFKDQRLRYIRTPRHFVIADNFEFALSHATGKLVLVLSDDDVLISTALERFFEESIRHSSDLLFSNVAEYRDSTFPGQGRNTLCCPPFTGAARAVEKAEFLEPLFDFQPKFNMHPSAFAFSRELALSIIQKVGRFFRTNGVEYYAWPLAAVSAREIVFVDAPLIICGRTGKSWGTNLVLANPGKKQIDELVADVDHERRHAPLNNFSFCNLMAEGMLTAKHLLPQELAPYRFNEINYLRNTFRELERRRRLGVDVSDELTDLQQYAIRYPALLDELTATRSRSLRSVVGDLGARGVWHRLMEFRRMRRDAKNVRAGHVQSSFCVSGSDFGFRDIVGCAAFLGEVITSPTADLADKPTPQVVSVVRQASAIGRDVARHVLPASTSTREQGATVHAQRPSDSIG
jgi:glycosyltransferase involved in cell wall biosynthesis